MPAENSRPTTTGPQQYIQKTQQDIFLAQSQNSIHSQRENVHAPYHNMLSESYLTGTRVRQLPSSTLPTTRGVNFSLPSSQYEHGLRRPSASGTNPGLPIMLERMRRCFWGRTSQQEIDRLTMSFIHLFSCADTLYRALLPELSVCLQQHPHHIEQPESEQDLELHYTIWTLLQDIEFTLAYLEPLNTLLISTSIDMVEALDRSCSIYGAARIKRQLQLDGTDEESTELLAAITTTHIPDNTYFHWMQAVSQVSESLQGWQRSQRTSSLFAQHFAMFASMIPTLSQLDSTLDLVSSCIQSIFGLLLPEFHTVARGDDETAATLLLDIVQKIDQIQLALDAQSAPLHILTREYGYKTTLH